VTNWPDVHRPSTGSLPHTKCSATLNTSHKPCSAT
jgi:hypothetical protein